MTTADFLTHAQLVASNWFISYLDQLRSGEVDVSDLNGILGRLARNTDAVAEVLASQSASLLTWSGTVSYANPNLVFSAGPTLNVLSRQQNVHEVYVSDTTIQIDGSSQLAYVTLSRESGTQTASVTVVNREDYIVEAKADPAGSLDRHIIAMGTEDGVILAGGYFVRDGGSLTDNGSVDPFYAKQSDFATLQSQVREDRNLFLSEGGVITWDSGTGILTWSADMVLTFPASAGKNTVAAGNATLAAGKVLIVTPSRAPGSDQALTPSVVDYGSAGDEHVVLAYRGSDDRVYLADGTALSDGDSTKLGGPRSGVQWFYRAVGDGTRIADITEGGSYPNRVYEVGTGGLMVYRNGVKQLTSDVYWSGSYPTGSVVGTLVGDEHYIEEMSDGSSGTRILWVQDHDGDFDDGIGHEDGDHTPAYDFPTAADNVEIFIGLQGEGPSPVESIGGYGVAGEALYGNVKIEGGTNVTVEHDAGNNSIKVNATGLGVSQLDVDGAGALTGAVGLESGQNIDLTRGGSSVEVAVDVNLASVKNSTAAATGLSPVHTVMSAGAIQGFNYLWFDGTSIRVSGGTLISDAGVFHRITTSSSFLPSAGVGSDPPPSNGWGYVYVRPAASEVHNASPQFGIGSQAPTTGGRHPTEEAWFLCSVYFESGSPYAFHHRNGHTLMTASLRLNASMTLTPDTTWKTEDCSALPGTALPQADLRVIVTFGAATTTEIDVRRNAGASVLRHTLAKTDSDGEVHFTVELDEDLSFEHRVPMGAVSSAELYLRGYYEDRSLAAGAMHDA
jgi:hypothetical protein